MRGPKFPAFLGPAALALVMVMVMAMAVVGGATGARAAPTPTPTPAPTPAPAAATGVAITSITTHGVDTAAVPGFAQSLSGGLAAGGLAVTDLAKVRAALKPHAGLLGCETAVCLTRIATLLQVPLCGRATVEATGTTTFRIEVVLTAVVAGKQAARVERRCELCTLKEAREALSQAAADAAKKVAGMPGLVPPRNKVRRLTPLRRRVVARRVIVTQPKPRFRLVDQGQPWRRGGVAAISAGVAALIPGAVLVALHGRDKTGGCAGRRCLYDTIAGGAALVAIGATAAVAGTVMLIYGLLKKRAKIPVHLTVGIDPRGGLHVWGRF
jgi:hypothetical protein